MRGFRLLIQPPLKNNMERNLSNIRILSQAENENHPIFSSLVEQILHLLNTQLSFSDILIHEGFPITLRQPKGLVAVTDSEITREEIEEFFQVIEPNWKDRIALRAFDRSINLQSARIRANCFTFQGKKQYGSVIRRFPKEPVPLANLGLHADEMKFAEITSGLVLIIGDTCQGKSTTIASILDEINKRRSGHIITIEDPVETLIPQRNCMITQREVGLDGDVESYYLGALDALRERPDVIVIGEIRDAQTAQECLALAESGPLVLASLHARSTELGLQKMVRLLGNSEAQNQALAHSLRGVLCQALLPGTDGLRYHLATECLTPTGEVTRMIEANYLSNIRAHMVTDSDPGCHTMNSVLEVLVAEGKISTADALNASTDRMGFAKIAKTLGIAEAA
jgi:twitching motility protein PilT